MQNSILVYTLVVLIATIVPGPSMILALNHGIKHGTQRTITTGVGNLLGNLILATFSMAGLGAIILASTPLFNVIRWIGAAYLIYLGLKTLFTQQAFKSDDASLNSKIKTNRGLFVNGFLVAASNPKGIVFFTAFFPQFFQPEMLTFSRYALLISILAVIALGCFMLYALFGATLSQFFRDSKAGKLFLKATGLVFIGFGLSLLFKRT